eukprot:m.124172 g.124172  ORF g.124172 m.124172 type:complete len:154 (+) comp17280_c1_seq25:524-985(+)
MAYIKEGSAKIHQAFGIEKNGDPDGAVVLLLEGCGDLVQGAKNDTDAKRQLAVRTKVAQYLQKAETIEKQLVDSHNKQMQDIQNKTDAAIAERLHGFTPNRSRHACPGDDVVLFVSSIFVSLVYVYYNVYSRMFGYMCRGTVLEAQNLNALFC